MPKLREYIVRGRVTFDGATFTVSAKDSQEAVEKVKQGDWTDVDTNGAELVDWESKNEAELNE